IVEPLCGSETSLVAAGDWDGVDIEISISLSDESERGSIRGPAMPIGWGIFGDLPGRAALDGHQINQGAVFFLGLIADGQPFRIRRNAVVVVAAVGEARVDDCRLAARYRQSQDVTIAVEEKRRAITGPVGCLEMFRRDVGYVAVSGGNGDGLQSAVE